MNVPDLKSVEVMEAVLSRFNWRRSGGMRGLFTVWVHDNWQDEVVLPRDPSRSDFAALYFIAEKQVAEKLGPEAIRVKDLIEMSISAELDEAHWKKDTPVAAGLISWNQGQSLYDAARSMLLASAKSTKEARMYHGNASAFVAKRFLDECLMGQTAVGSFIITAHTPADRKFPFSQRAEETPGVHSEAASGREIMNKFQSVLELTRECLDEFAKNPSMGVFDEAVPLGLSFEFVRALGEASSDGDSAVEVICGSPSNRQPSKEVTFDAVEAPVLKRVAIRFAQAFEPAEITLVGEVVLLSHVSNSDEHVIRLIADRGSYVSKVRVRLNAEQYESAIEAHATDRKIEVSGRVEREGNVHWIYSPKVVKIVGRKQMRAETVPLFDIDAVLEEGF